MAAGAVPLFLRVSTASSPKGGADLIHPGEDSRGPSAYDMTMDAFGARLLAARIAAGVRIGSVIELVEDSDQELRAGDRGVVREIEADGAVVVEWERGFHRAIDPHQSTYRALPAA